MPKLPKFLYHPNPLETGSIKQSDGTCIVCRKSRGFLYSGPTYAPGVVYDDCICPWCIADGLAYNKLGVTFADASFIGGVFDWPRVSPDIVDEVTNRTPGYSTWQGVYWFTHCNDSGAYLGSVGYKELSFLGPEAIHAIKLTSGVPEQDWDNYFHALEKNGAPTAYLFRYIHCVMYGGYSDCD
jgi:uncharacterized protein CbrC (UPF0167 family)